MSGIVEASLAHAQVFVQMHAIAFPDDPWDSPSFSALLQQPGMRGWIDEHGGFLLVRVVLDEAEVITLGVMHPRQGIATHLLQAAIECLGVAKIHLEVSQANTAALALYSRFGFTQSGRRKAYYPDGGDALTFTLELGERR